MLQSLTAHYFGMAVRTGSLMVISHVLVAVAFYYLYRKPSIAWWGAAAVIVPLVRLGVILRYRRTLGAYDDPQLWERRIFYMTTLIAVIFASGLLVLFEEGKDIYNGLLTLYYLMMVSATASSASAMKRTMLAYCGIVGFSLAIRFAFLDQAVYWLASIGIALYTLAQMLFGLQSYRLQTVSLKQSLVNKALVRQLEEQVRIAVGAVNDAQRASQEKSRFIAAASHDLRQPLHALALASDALHRKLTRTDHAQDVELLQQSVSALGNSLNAMLDLSKLDAGAIAAKVEAVRVSEIFSQLHQTYLDMANAKGLALRFVHRGAVVSADRHLLTRLLGNLVANAIKYTDRGGVLVVARQRRACGAGALMIEVRDSGIGIAQPLQEQVFDEFFQIGNPGRIRSQGLGLGLSIVKRLAALMDMKVAISSQPGCGTRFVVHCRAAVDAPAGVSQHIEHASLTTSPSGRFLEGRRILVVDNEAAIVHAITDLLSYCGAQVDVALDATEAQAKLATGPGYDLALLDYRLGEGMNGSELARKGLRLQSKPLKVVLITGDTDSVEIRAMKASGVDIVFKPIRGEALLKLVGNLLAHDKAD